MDCVVMCRVLSTTSALFDFVHTKINLAFGAGHVTCILYSLRL